ncbi:hypothetical protein LIER_26688 [Lithospermum erythrorhizon]|uniref:Uncharacterized protein n=1 Tax=Lithospermum erythrorhizon TaxID=34254 RepID=A0AAV3R995_LITER
MVSESGDASGGEGMAMPVEEREHKNLPQVKLVEVIMGVQVLVVDEVNFRTYPFCSAIDNGGRIWGIIGGWGVGKGWGFGKGWGYGGNVGRGAHGDSINEHH